MKNHKAIALLVYLQFSNRYVSNIVISAGEVARKSIFGNIRQYKNDKRRNEQ